MIYTLLGLVILVLDINAILSVLRSHKETLINLVWVLLILALPVIGNASWFLVGQERPRATLD
jgi:hypothetical protein